ncbi:hypothetical protein T02_8160 [Trichinella nativa]|uniref:Uncharacterized protein n=1 Tax=Trichinella nativa TaxID=6335 RepID=A0A0V1L4L6_9BILA|nr:hypothetical protein T02_8160 [Trichinella nativa]
MADVVASITPARTISANLTRSVQGSRKANTSLANSSIASTPPYIFKQNTATPNQQTTKATNEPTGNAPLPMHDMLALLASRQATCQSQLLQAYVIFGAAKSASSLE